MRVTIAATGQPVFSDRTVYLTSHSGKHLGDHDGDVRTQKDPTHAIDLTYS